MIPHSKRGRTRTFTVNTIGCSRLTRLTSSPGWGACRCARCSNPCTSRSFLLLLKAAAFESQISAEHAKRARAATTTLCSTKACSFPSRSRCRALIRLTRTPSSRYRCSASLTPTHALHLLTTITPLPFRINTACTATRRVSIDIMSHLTEE